MQYTVCSRGVPIGTTDLAFIHVGSSWRMGWFFPNAAGERLMPAVSAMPHAVRALAEPDAASLVGDPGRDTARADLAEASQHVEALDLTLLREDGTPIACEDIGIRDTEAVAAAFGVPLPDLGDDDAPFDDAPFDDADIDDATELDDDEIERIMDENPEFASRVREDAAKLIAILEEREASGYVPGPMGRYQICVHPLHQEDIP